MEISIIDKVFIVLHLVECLAGVLVILALSLGIERTRERIEDIERKRNLRY